jgi:hypothetical protein
MAKPKRWTSIIVEGENMTVFLIGIGGVFVIGAIGLFIVAGTWASGIAAAFFWLLGFGAGATGIACYIKAFRDIRFVEERRTKAYEMREMRERNRESREAEREQRDIARFEREQAMWEEITLIQHYLFSPSENKPDVEWDNDQAEVVD